MRRPLPFASIKNVLDDLIRDYGMEGQMAEHRLQAEWPVIVGHTIALHSTPGPIRFRKLYLAVDGPGWMQELSFLKPELLKKVNSALARHRSEFYVKEIVLKMEGTPPGEDLPKGSSGFPRASR